jgi:hypothetical protein
MSINGENSINKKAILPIVCYRVGLKILINNWTNNEALDLWFFHIKFDLIL